jgi:hypothetical protein
MEKMDGLGWTADFAFIRHAVRVGTRVNNPVVLERLPGILPPRGRRSRRPWFPSCAR